jgi:hypothetical protein
MSTAVAQEYDTYVRTEWKLLCEKRLGAPDMSPVDIGKAMGYSPQTIRVWLRDPTYQRYENFCIAQRREELVGVPLPSSPRFKTDTVPERFTEYAANMQERLLDMIETSTNEGLVAKYASEWLERAGHQLNRPTAQHDTRPQISAEQMYVFLVRAKEAGLALPIPAEVLPG